MGKVKFGAWSCTGRGNHHHVSTVQVSMSIRIIGIHGLRNKPASDLLREWWLCALQEGLLRIGKPHPQLSLDLVYWSDLLYPEPLDPEISDPDDELYLDEPYLAGVASQEDEDAGLKDIIRHYIERQMHQLLLRKDLSLKNEAFANALLKKLFRDLDLYFNEVRPENGSPTIRENIHERLLAAIEKAGRHKVILLAHSMGSIIAFDVMTRYPERTRNVETLVTMGSPLGQALVIGKLAGELGKIRNGSGNLSTPPALSGRWVNLADPRDLIAFDQTLANDYQENAWGVRPVDLRVFNDYMNGDEENAHKSFGYLRCEELAREVDTFITSHETRWDRLLVQPLGRLKTWWQALGSRFKR